MDTTLERLGWTGADERLFQPYAEQQHLPGRIAVEHRDMYLAYTAVGERWAEITGKMRHSSDERGELPAVGDWVALQPRPGDDRATIHAVLPRRSAFSRKVAGFETAEQVLAANIDLVWIVSSMTRELSARRMEHYLAVAWNSGAQPVVVLTKADLGECDPERVAEVEAVSVGASFHVTSAVTGEGIDALRAELEGNRTAAVLGSSGVGKSTLINYLVGSEHLATKETRADDVGRHTTTHRELVLIPSGGLLIDTPGLREIVMWDGDTDAAFSDIASLAAECRFRDCNHHGEPGCAVRNAIASGDLDLARWRSYEKMQRELAYVEGRKNGRPSRAIRNRNKDIAKFARQRRKLGMDRPR